jgi:hypothetical protein
MQGARTTIITIATLVKNKHSIKKKNQEQADFLSVFGLDIKSKL